jgi:hypothetical protein
VFFDESTAIAPSHVSSKEDLRTSSHPSFGQHFVLLLLIVSQYSVSGGGPVGGSLNYIVEQEQNNTVAAAQMVAGRNLKIKGNIQPGTDVDYYSFPGTAGDRLYDWPERDR